MADEHGVSTFKAISPLQLDSSESGAVSQELGMTANLWSFSSEASTTDC